MDKKSEPISREDYIEPCCPLKVGPGREIQPIPQSRVLEKLDEYMQHRDFSGAERHLLYWMDEARAGKDLQGQLLICNEMIGFYRKSEMREKAYAAIEKAQDLLCLLNLTDSISAGTTYVNAATAYSAFGEEEKALALFTEARRIYENSTGVGPELLGGLYNNMGISCAALERFSEARSLYELALTQMRKVKGSEPEQAITYLNMADAIDAEFQAEADAAQISKLLQRAKELILDPDLERSGYYAFVCEKCAPGFRYYGDEETALKLEKLAEEIYAGT